MARMIAIPVGALLVVAGVIVFLMHLWAYGVVLGVIGATVITMAVRNARRAQHH
jgi:branched-subunit amino acid transport protein AzlD